MVFRFQKQKIEPQGLQVLELSIIRTNRVFLCTVHDSKCLIMYGVT